MTERDWLEGTDPQTMLAFLRNAGKLSERKVRLLCVAMCRWLWPLLTEASREAVSVTEYDPGGAATEDGRVAAYAPSTADLFHPRWAHKEGELAVALTASMPADKVDRVAVLVMFFVGRAIAQSKRPHLSDSETLPEVRKQQSDILRDLLVNPFRAAPTLEPSLLHSNGGTVVQLARAAYEQRMMPEGHLDPARLTVLADALEEGGCATPEILAHLRAPGPHWRGCWAVDHLLGQS
jgi:hypothetical protein